MRWALLKSLRSSNWPHAREVRQSCTLWSSQGSRKNRWYGKTSLGWARSTSRLAKVRSTIMACSEWDLQSLALSKASKVLMAWKTAFTSTTARLEHQSLPSLEQHWRARLSSMCLHCHSMSRITPLCKVIKLTLYTSWTKAQTVMMIAALCQVLLHRAFWRTSRVCRQHGRLWTSSWSSMCS